MKYVYAVATSDEQVHVGETRNLSATLARIAIEVVAGGKDCLWCMVSPTVAEIHIESTRLRGGYAEAASFMSSRQLPYIELTPAKYNGIFHFVTGMHRRSSVRMACQDDVDALVIRVVGSKTLTSGVIINRCRKYSRDDVTASIRRLTERGSLREDVTTHERNLTQVYSYTLDPSCSTRYTTSSYGGIMTLRTLDLFAGSGGFPCQDLSSAGRGAGIGEGTRSGLFREMLRLACEVREITGRLPYIVFENVARLLSGPTEDPGQWFGEFLHALAEVGYDAEWFCVTASGIGAPHKRERVCVVAYPNASLGERGGISSRVYQKYADIDSDFGGWGEWGGGESEICGVDDGIQNRSHRLALMGNAIVPQCFAPVMEAVRECLNN